MQSQKTQMLNQILAAAALALLVAMLGARQSTAAPMGNPQQQQYGSNQPELDDLGDDGENSPQIMGGAHNRRAQLEGGPENDFGPSMGAGSGGNFNNDMGQQQYANFRPQAAAAGNQQQQQLVAAQQQAQASENNENNAEDNETDADDDSDFGAMGLTSANAGAASNANQGGYRPWGSDDSQAAAAGAPQSQYGGAGEGELESAMDGGEPDGLDSNIANAKIEMTPNDMATAAGHHHHHGHHVHGWLKMGAETGKKGAFKWHDKHPVGGKGRR